MKCGSAGAESHKPSKWAPFRCRMETSPIAERYLKQLDKQKPHDISALPTRRHQTRHKRMAGHSPQSTILLNCNLVSLFSCCSCYPAEDNISCSIRSLKCLSKQFISFGLQHSFQLRALHVMPITPFEPYAAFHQVRFRSVRLISMFPE